MDKTMNVLYKSGLAVCGVGTLLPYHTFSLLSNRYSLFLITILCLVSILFSLFRFNPRVYMSLVIIALVMEVIISLEKIIYYNAGLYKVQFIISALFILLFIIMFIFKSDIKISLFFNILYQLLFINIYAFSTVSPLSSYLPSSFLEAIRYNFNSNLFVLREGYYFSIIGCVVALVGIVFLFRRSNKSESETTPHITL